MPAFSYSHKSHHNCNYHRGSAGNKGDEHRRKEAIAAAGRSKKSADRAAAEKAEKRRMIRAAQQRRAGGANSAEFTMEDASVAPTEVSEFD